MELQTAQESPDVAERRSCFAAALIIVLVFGVVCGALSWMLVKSADRSRQEFEQRQADRRIEYFNRAKAGDDGSRITIMDPLLLEMLAGDPDCVANLTALNFSMVDVTGPPSAAAKSLVNVKEIYFYDCGRVDDLLRALEGSPAVEDVYFEMAISNEIIASLGSFKNLKKVDIFGYRVSAEQEALLRQALPDVEIVIDDG